MAGPAMLWLQAGAYLLRAMAVIFWLRVLFESV